MGIVALAAFATAGFVKKSGAEAVDNYAKTIASRRASGLSTYSDPERPDPMPAGVPIVAGSVILALAIGSFFLAATYKQDEGEAKVMRSFTGQVIGSPDETSGLSLKKPWHKAVTFDIRNNIVEFDGINFTDKNGTGGTVGVKVTYSLRSDMVDEVYKEYKTQAKFEKDLITNDVSAVVRQVPGKYSNVELLANREQVSNDILAALDKRWGDAWGVTGLQVQLGEIVYSEKIKERLENLTAEQTRAEEAIAATRTAKELAAQKVAQAKGEADSNREMERSLTPAVLENRRIEMLKVAAENGNLIITDGKTTPMLNIDGKK